MLYRNFNSEIGSVSEIGLGCWQLGGSDWGSIAESEATSIMHAALDAGTTFFDTADVYGMGRSEELIGRFLKETQAKITVGTKLGRFLQPGWPGNFEPQPMREHTEASLKRLGAETLDLTQLHCVPTEVLRRGEVFDTLRRLRQEGKIRAFGVSVESMEEADICLEHSDVSSLQIIFNVLRQKPIDTLFARAMAQGVGLIVRLPLASGLLSGKYDRDTVFPPEDHRNYNRNGDAFNVGETFSGLTFEKGLDIVERLWPLVPEGMTMAMMSLRWCLDYDAVTTVIPGAKSAAMAVENAAVSSLTPLSNELHRALRNLYETEVAEFVRGPY